ncbi:MAG: extracellular solute-binding protein [Limnochordia bacterium]|jgi:putative aldouronate transport system substrate-binding protein|nr:extracellular solute-binding protein [Limnochordia bacterium]
MQRTRLVVLGLTLVLLMAFASVAVAAELVDGRFTTTRKITVEIYDRSNPGGTTPEDNFFTNFIKEGMLRDHNVEVEFIAVPRWTEDQAINNLLAAGDAPDIGVTYSFPTIQTYANMGGVVNMDPYLTEYKELLPHLWNLLGDTNIYWSQDPDNGSVWAIEAVLFQNKRINTFVREDWLNKLGLAKPTTLEEFENMLRAFRDNAEVLLGADADKMIPYSTSFDIGWRNDHMFISFVPEKLSDREMYVFGFDDRRLLYPNYKEGVRKLNEWYNEGLVWKDFALYGAGDTTEDNQMKAGYVGAFMHNWDYPYRDGQEGIHANLQNLVGEDAAYIAVEPFQNDAGIYRKYLSAPIDRKVFFPSTNDEVLASLLYLNWLANIENRRFLQIGEEGVHHMITESGAVQSLPVVGEKIMNSPQNIDYTIVINGLDLGDPVLTSKSIALNYSGVDARFIEPAYIITSNEARYGKNVQVGEIRAEEGMGTVLSEKRNTLLAQAVVAKPGEFDAVWDRGFTDYLRSGGQAIINERAQKYDVAY